MNNPPGVSPSKGNQGTTRGKEKSFDLSGNRTHDLRIRYLISTSIYTSELILCSIIYAQSCDVYSETRDFRLDSSRLLACFSSGNLAW